MNELCIRPAAAADAAGLLSVYAPFVSSEDRRLSDVSFEYEVPSEAEFAGRIKEISRTYPYLLCECGKELLGYVYAHPFIPRAAYQWGAEVTVYLAPAGQGWGLGPVMYTALEQLLRLQGVVKTYACVTASNEHSVRMHESMGYRITGSFKRAGFKHGHWLDMVWLEKSIAACPQTPQPLRSWRELPAGETAAVMREAARRAAALRK